MAVQLLKPLIQKEKITQPKLLPIEVQSLAKNYSVVHKVTITPQKTATSGLCKTRILAAASFGSPGLVPINMGRVGNTPAANAEDMRPAVFYMLGTGTFKFRTNLQTDTNHYTEVEVKFE